MTAIASSALVSLVVLAALLFVIYGPWQWVCTDFARQRLFEARDHIFDMAADGRLNFKSQDYRVIRRSLEMNIRFAHDLTLPNFLFLAIARKRRPGEMSDLHRAIENLPLEVRSEVKKIVHDGMKILILMMIFKSPVAIITIGPAIVASLLIDGCRKQAARAVKVSSALIQVEAENAPSAFVTGGAH
ncbi:hypothetical protein [Bradyrhizobium archetypum]|uniref:Uncharacterized protein n=1 Tax=Bradyrhizobium archetypum TaxID=2721160 RepID=A0A7Y4H5Q3_9BRAD|nr:hypothetical protein [Bradyrhizobium archetypum]NOJ47824.1 hypothetical protein [Bradyrhizobium archetypum]